MIFLNTAHFTGCHVIASQDLSFIFLPFYNDVISNVSDYQSKCKEYLNDLEQCFLTGGPQKLFGMPQNLPYFGWNPNPPHITTLSEQLKLYNTFKNN